ncbi:MAG: zinc ribbon domain-containing protein [Chloroflexi bacterium]|nr:zinc ribbon domain-containing protein [Chloroflexota bacterium]
MECPHCHRAINVSVSTCPHCGAEVMKVCSACKNYVRAELEHCPSCGTPVVSLTEVARTVKAQRDQTDGSGSAGEAPAAGESQPARSPGTGPARVNWRTFPMPGRATWGWLALALVVYGGLVVAAALLLRSAEPVPLLILGMVIGGALGALLGLGKALVGLSPRQDNILMDIWPGLGTGAFTGLFLAFFNVQENLLAPEVLLVAAAGAMFGLLFSVAFSWGSGPEGARGLRGFIGNPVVGLLLGICLGIGCMIGLGNLMLQLRRPGGGL